MLVARNLIKSSPLVVSIPAEINRSPEDPLGLSGRMRVEMASLMNVSDAAGPVLKAGPMEFALTQPNAATINNVVLPRDNIVVVRAGVKAFG